jgi:hypothetical protein
MTCEDKYNDGRAELLHFRCAFCSDKVVCHDDADDYYPYCSKACETRDTIDTIVSAGVSERDIYSWR